MSIARDGEQALPPLKLEKSRTRLSDRILMAAGITLAIASASFPWYVFFNEDKFGVQTADFGRTRDLPPGVARPVVTVSPLAMTDSSKDDWPAPAEAMDSLTTATTTSALGDVRNGATLREEQPFPGKGGFRLLHVANGRALIEDGSGMYMVRIGSILPDNSKLATLEQRDGRWVIITSSGEVYQDAGQTAP